MTLLMIGLEDWVDYPFQEHARSIVGNFQPPLEAETVSRPRMVGGHAVAVRTGKRRQMVELRGLDPGIVMAELLGKSAGANRGKGGRGHISQPSSGFFGAHAVVGGNLSIAAGVALARKLAESQGIVTVMFGDGACGAGTLHETLNIAAVWRLPLLFVCNNNQFSVSTPVSAAIAPNPISDLAVAYGLTLADR